jgi:peptide/nickel transport system substrate-binding protein
MLHPSHTLRQHPRWILFSSLAILFVMLLAACGGTTTTQQNSSQNSVLTIVPSPIGDFTRNFSPFAANNDYGTDGLIYETLLFFNREDGSIHPWLASSYQFSPDGKTLTFTLHSNVQWSDGQPFTSDDVVFTLDLMHQYPDADGNGLWQDIASVANPDAHTVIVTLKHPASPDLWYLAGQTYIVPKHLWSNVGDPAKYANPNPVGTGPYLLKSFTPQLIDYTRNPHYWQAEPAVQEVRYPAFDSNTSAELLLSQGNVDWTGLYTPNIQQTFVSRDPAHNHYWFPAASVQTLYLNTAEYPFNLLPIRQAISMAIDRDQLYKVGENGYEPPASPTDLVLPAQQSYLAPNYANLTFTVNDAQANSLIQSQGFHKGSDGIYVDSKGKRLSFQLNVVTGWTDWVSDCQIIQQELKQIGIDVQVNAISFNSYYSAMQLGKFDMVMSWTDPGPTPYYLYNAMLNSNNTAPIGQAATSNFERWSDKQTDALLKQYATSVDPNVQKQAIEGLEQIMVNKLPTIPLVYNATWYEYSTAHFTGWPDQNHAYAVPSPYSFPDAEVVILNLKPTA